MEANQKRKLKKENETEIQFGWKKEFEMNSPAYLPTADETSSFSMIFFWSSMAP